MVEIRKERILWLASQIARKGAWLTWDDGGKRFGVNPKYDEKEIDLSKVVNKMHISGANSIQHHRW
jgi:uncharacterized protein YlxW (UPF0749 family)